MSELAAARERWLALAAAAARGARRRAGLARGAARGGARRVRRRGPPEHAPGGVALHERRAARRASPSSPRPRRGAPARAEVEAIVVPVLRVQRLRVRRRPAARRALAAPGALAGAVRVESLASRTRAPAGLGAPSVDTEAAPLRRAEHRALRGRRAASPCLPGAVLRAADPPGVRLDGRRRAARELPARAASRPERGSRALVIQDHVTPRRRAAPHERGHRGDGRRERVARARAASSARATRPTTSGTSQARARARRALRRAHA